MKDIRLALRALLLSDPTVSGLVGGQRVYPVQLPQGQRSQSIVYHRITDFSDYHLQGDSGRRDTFMQLDSYATTADGSVALADAVYDLLSGFRGLVSYGSNSPQDSIALQGVFVSNGRDLFDDPTQLYRMSRDYQIVYGAR